MCSLPFFFFIGSGKLPVWGRWVVGTIVILAVILFMGGRQVVSEQLKSELPAAKAKVAAWMEPSSGARAHSFVAAKMPPRCDDAKDIVIPDGSGPVTVHMQPDCTTGKITTPISWRTWHLNDVANVDKELWFEDGYHVKRGQNQDGLNPNRRAIFIARGVGDLIVSENPV
jgi:hypothetical protein